MVAVAGSGSVDIVLVDVERLLMVRERTCFEPYRWKLERIDKEAGAFGKVDQVVSAEIGKAIEIDLAVVVVGIEEVGIVAVADKVVGTEVDLAAAVIAAYKVKPLVVVVVVILEPCFQERYTVCRKDIVGPAKVRTMTMKVKKEQTQTSDRIPVMLSLASSDPVDIVEEVGPPSLRWLERQTVLRSQQE